MKIEIKSTLWYETKDFVWKYGEKLEPYNLKIKKDRAYITVTSIQKLVDLPKLVGEIIIGRNDDDSLFIEIYDSYRE